MENSDQPKFNREKYKNKLKIILQYEIDMGLVKRKAGFARKYGVKPQDLNGYLKQGHINYKFIEKLCREYNLTTDYLIFDKNPINFSKPTILPPLIIPAPETE